MINFKLRYAIARLLLLMIVQFIGMNVPRMMAATGQDVDAHRPTLDATGSTAFGFVISKRTVNPVHQRLVAAQGATVLFCISENIPQPLCLTATDLVQLPRTTAIPNSKVFDAFRAMHPLICRRLIENRVKSYG